MATNRWIRVSDQDRLSAGESLSEASAVGRLSREELDERLAVAYSAKTCGELRDLTADLPLPAARTGLPSDIVTSRRTPQSASRRLIGQLIWTFFVRVLAVSLAGLVPPVAVWIAAFPIPLALLLTPPPGISRQRSTRAGNATGTPRPRARRLAAYLCRPWPGRETAVTTAEQEQTSARHARRARHRLAPRSMGSLAEPTWARPGFAVRFSRTAWPGGGTETAR